jgi:hypothetical protein
MKMQVMRVLLPIGIKAVLDGSLDRPGVALLGSTRSVRRRPLLDWA